MKTMYHPTTGSARQVPDADVDAWSEAGWRKTKPKTRIVGEKGRELDVPADAGRIVPT